MSALADLVGFVVHRLVQHPGEVSLEAQESEDGCRIQLKVHPEDMGRVIGRGGRTAKAMRTIVSTAAGKADMPVQLEILD